jgi:hypothetical protein
MSLWSRRWVADDPLLVIRRQAIPESHAEIVEKPANVHSAILAGLSRYAAKRTLMPRVVRNCCLSSAVLWPEILAGT